MLHTPSSRCLSPAPPYQSVLQSPDPSNNHEIDSTTIHEIESPPLQQWMFIPQPGVVELPDTSGEPWRSSIPNGFKPGSPGK